MVSCRGKSRGLSWDSFSRGDSVLAFVDVSYFAESSRERDFNNPYAFWTHHSKTGRSSGAAVSRRRPSYAPVVLLEYTTTAAAAAAAGGERTLLFYEKPRDRAHFQVSGFCIERGICCLLLFPYFVSVREKFPPQILGRRGPFLKIYRLFAQLLRFAGVRRVNNWTRDFSQHRRAGTSRCATRGAG